MSESLNKTMRLSPDDVLRVKELPKDRCTLVMLTGPTPGAVQVVEDEALVMGRGTDVSVQIADPGISSRHARVFLNGGRYWVEDLGSTNGTHLNGRRLDTLQALSDGDRLQLGQTTLLRVALQDATEQEAARRIYEAAVRDPLTKLYNRGHLDRVLAREYAYATRHQTALAVLFIDLDFFSRVNNTYGHQAGDLVLRTVAHTIQRAVRTEDVVARYGGEEFVLVARGLGCEHALQFGERLRQMIEAQSIPWGETMLQVTGSIGSAAYEPATPYPSLQELLAAADRAVYKAKNDGRNRVCGP
jgi:two-component system, cell cycle response regulator